DAHRRRENGRLQPPATLPASRRHVQSTARNNARFEERMQFTDRPQDRGFGALRGERSMSTRSGSITFRRGSWYARLIYIDPATGQRRDLWKACESKVAARQQKDAWLREIDDSGAESLLKSRATFAEFAEWFKATYLVAATYTPDGQKEHGLRSLRTAE